MYESDGDIIMDILQGNSEAFKEIVSRYKNAVYSLCYRMVYHKEEAEDLAQEVFIKVYRSLDKYNPQYKFSTWIFKITTNTALDYLRKKRIEVLPLEEKIKSKQETASAEIIFFHRHNKNLIEKAIDNLPVDYRTLILLYHHYGLSYKEISENMKLPMSKVKNRLHRARNMLKECLKSIKEEEAQWTARQVQI